MSRQKPVGALLDAGAIVSGAAPARDRSLDTITARSYQHRALDDRLVIRLVPGTLGEAEDLSMEFLGFDAAGKPVPVGHGRRQALGFPAWALIHDPANGRHALAMVKEMERLARLAKAKPGNAKEGYDVLAERLGAAAPHFLPTFWEQAGRAYLAAENAKAAGTCFAAARLAEQVHGLPVDEERLRDVHLEFAFAGALPAKAVSEYARQVADRRPPAEVYELVRGIALRRVAGGLPPYVGMAEDLRRLAKAAGLDPDAEAESVVAELLAYPAMARSHEGVWKSFRPALVRLARRDPAIRGTLLTLLPDPPGYDVDFTEGWLELLDVTGAADALRAPDAAPETARPPDGVAGWVQRFQDHRGRGWRRKARSPRWLALLGQLVDRVRAELVASGRELSVCRDGLLWRVDLDGLDICLAAGLPVTYGESRYRLHFDVSHWSGGPDDGRRDLAAVAADARSLPHLIEGLRSHLGAHSDDRSSARRMAAIRSPHGTLEPVGLRTAAQAWLAALAEWVGPTPSVPALAHALDAIAPLWTSAGAALAPAVFQRLADADVAEALAGTLRAGSPSELGWPAYDAARGEMATQLTLEAWPALVIADNRRAIVVGPEGVLLDHAYRLPPEVSRPNTARCSAYVDGQIRVSWWGGCYWSGRPTEVISAGPSLPRLYPSGVSLPLPTGGRTSGGKPLHVGDGTDVAAHGILSDGVSYWRLDRGQAGPRPGPGSADQWREYDPTTGEPGRASRPAFLDVGLPEGDHLVPHMCYLHPAPAGYADSPLGYRDGLVGWRVVRHPDGSLTGTGVDGRGVRWWPSDGAAGEELVGALRLPGDDRPRPVTIGGWLPGGQYGRRVTLWDAAGRQPVSRVVTGMAAPPVEFWHALRPRDERGSAVLRTVDAARAARLLDACASAEPAELTPAAREAVREVLPEVTDQSVIRDVAQAVSAAEQVRRVQGQLRDLLTMETAGPAEPEGVPVARSSEDDLLRAIAGVAGQPRYYRHFRGLVVGMAAQVRALGAILTSGQAMVAGWEQNGDQSIPLADPSWADLLPWLGAVLLRAASPLTVEADRVPLRSLLAMLMPLGVAGTDPRLRVLEVAVPQDMLDQTSGAVLHTDTSRLVLLPGPAHYYENSSTWIRTAIQFSPTGAFDLPPKVVLRTETRLTGWGDPARLREAVGLLTRNGPAGWRPELVGRLVDATGMSRAEAALLLAGLPGLNRREANFLSPEQRSLLDLKATEARAARDSLAQLSPEHRLALLDAAMPADPADLWRHGPDVDALAARWTALFGRTHTISAELLTEAGRMLPSRKAADILRTLARPRPGDWLHTDGVTSTDHWRLPTSSPDGEAFSGSHLPGVAIALPWLAYRLPAGDPVRAALPTAYQLVRQRLTNPDLLVGYTHHPSGSVPSGLTALVEQQQSPEYTAYFLRPARLTGPDDPSLAFANPVMAASLRLLLSASLESMLAGLTADPTPAGRYPHDPAVSVPDLVDAVASAHALAPAAGAYYLQLLALPDPTDQRVTEWNRWTAAQLREVKAALAATDLVVAAKRERTGRTLFLPGGWLPLKSPNLPVEAWKSGLGIGTDGALPEGRVLVTTSVPDLFRAAWARVSNGDAPRYHALSEKP